MDTLSQFSNIGIALVFSCCCRDGSAALTFTDRMSVPIPYAHSTNDGDAETDDLKRKAAEEVFARLVGTHAWRNQQLETRGREVSTLLDKLLGCQFDGIWSPTSNARSILERLFMLPIASVALTGHSFGGCTAMYVAARDDRVHECISLDPWMFPLPSGDINKWYCRLQPLRVLVINSHMFQWAENVFAMRQYLSHVANGEARMKVLLASTHHDFTDFACLVKPWIIEWARSPISQIVPEVAILASVAATLNFLAGDHDLHAEEHDWAWKRALSAQDLQEQPLD